MTYPSQIVEIQSGLTPQEAYRRIRHLPWAVLLESTATEDELARHSFVTADPFLRLESHGTAVTVEGQTPESILSHAPPLTVLGEILGGWDLSPAPDLPPFQGGAVGYFAYELGRSIESVPVAALDDHGLPEMRIGIYDWTLAWDREQERCWLISTGLGSESLTPDPEAADERTRTIISLLEADRGAEIVAGERDSGDDVELAEPPATHPVPGLPGVHSTFSKRRYLETVQTVRDCILDGEIFQANLSHRLELPCLVDPFELYRRLSEVNPSAFAAYIELDGGAIVSASPERFLRVWEDRVERRPIKGTAPRGDDPERNRQVKHSLRESEKDRSENVMIVDLIRNDLSRVCLDHSVQVPTLCRVESYPAVYHLVSTVTGRLSRPNGPVEALEAAFPGGSITGAPKLRAMEILADLEPTCRSVYTGSIGYIGFDGTMDTSIAIRTIIVRGGKAYIQVGGGVVAASDPEAEYDETLDKARGLLRSYHAPGMSKSNLDPDPEA